jgi:hypothetical protein
MSRVPVPPLRRSHPIAEGQAAINFRDAGRPHHEAAEEPLLYRTVNYDRLFDRNPNYARLHHAERSGSAQRYINDTAPNERPSIIYATAY